MSPLKKQGSNELKANDTQQIRRMLLLRLFLLPLAVLLVVCGTIIYLFATYSSRQVKSELARIAFDHRSLIHQFLTEKIAILKFVAVSFSCDELSAKHRLDSIFKNLQAQSKAFSDLGVFDAEGNHLAYAGPFDLVGKSYAQAEWFKAVRSQAVFISDEFLGYREIPHFIIAVRRQENGKLWYLRATIDTYYFNDLVENIRIGRTGEAYIINANGILQTRRRSGGRIMELDPEFGHGGLAQDQHAGGYTQTSFKSRFLYVTAPIDQTDWLLIVRQAREDAFAPVILAILISVVLLAVAGTGVTITGKWMATNMATRLKLADMEKREMRTQLILAGKMAEVGEMSTSIAHEINNPLQVMVSELAMIQSIAEDLEPIIPDLHGDKIAMLNESREVIGNQIKRCSKITQGLLNFARKAEPALAPVKLQTLVPQMVKMVDQRARVENIRIIEQIEDQLPEIMSDAGQLQQVFLNLLNNAIYACRGRSQSEIRIQTLQKGNEIVICVADNGCGFKPEDMEKAFRPFFTTKPVGQGTGLGLSTAYGIIKGLGGEITLTSEYNAGSVFQIRLPISNIADTPDARN